MLFRVITQAVWYNNGMEIWFRIVMFVIGACIGSFLCCQARRLHIRNQSKEKHKSLNKRSICLHCKKQLKWYDNIPIISWLALRGKCRHCHKKIGLAEFLSEITTGVALLLLCNTINLANATILDWAIFAVAIVLTFTFIFLAIYDGLYGELPSLCLVLSIIFAIILLSLKIYSSLLISPFTPALIIDPLLSIAILGGLYFALYLISKGKWVGDGDWLLGTAIAIALGTPWLALIVLFLSNFLACLIMYPIMKSPSDKRSRPHHKIHFGPFLVIAFIITYSFASFFTALLS